MKKASIGNRKPLKRASGTPKTIDEYLLRIPEPARRTLKKVRAAIRSVVPPEATETISYRIPAFRYNGVLVWFAAFSGHWSLFPTSAVFEEFKEELPIRQTTANRPHHEDCKGEGHPERRQEEALIGG
jgi:ABC-type microcin C transport system permease subunit YejB